MYTQSMVPRIGMGDSFNLHVNIVEIHESKDAGERCLVYLLDLYLAKIPQYAKDKDIFYCKPLQNYTHWMFGTLNNPEENSF